VLVMKLVISVVNNQIVPGLVEKLLEKGIKVTRLASSGGFLRKGNTTLISGVEDDEVQLAVQTIKDFTEKKKLENIKEFSDKKKAIEEGLATLFVVQVENTMHF